MDQYIIDKMQELTDINQTILDNWQEIRKKEEEYKQLAQINHKTINQKAQEGVDLKETLVSFNVNDVANELKTLLGVSDIYITMQATPVFSKHHIKDFKEYLKKQSDNKCYVQYNFYLTKYGDHEYRGNSILCLDDIQADGKPLIDHIKPTCFDQTLCAIDFDNYKDIILTEKLGNLIIENGTKVESRYGTICKAILNVAKEYKQPNKSTNTELEK